MKTTNNVLLKIEKQTVNRGLKTFIVSGGNGKYFAHELGELTQFAQVFNTGELKAHRINASVRYGNQYVRSFKPKPFSSLDESIKAIELHSNTAIQYF